MRTTFNSKKLTYKLRASKKEEEKKGNRRKEKGIIKRERQTLKSCFDAKDNTRPGLRMGQYANQALKCRSVTQGHPEGSWRLREHSGMEKANLYELQKHPRRLGHPGQQQGALQAAFCHPPRTHTGSLPRSSAWSCCTCQSRLVRE